MSNDLKERIKRFSTSIAELVRQMPNSIACRAIADQLVWSGTSVDANYRAVCMSRTEKEYLANMNLVLEEADQICFWMGFILQKKWLDNEKVTRYLNEANELTAMLMNSVEIVNEKKSVIHNS